MKLKTFVIIMMVIVSFTTISFAERLVDIPVPPNSSGYADFTEKEAAEQEKVYEESKNNITADSLVGKSSDNYLKSLSVEGYELSPEFNRQQDTYTIYVKDDSVNTFNVLAEPDNETAKIEGIGNVTVSADERIINIKVTAENGDLKVYTIKVENEATKKSEPINYNNIIIIIAIVIIIFIILVILLRKKNKRGN
jgi:hypothetical protein